MPLVHPGDKLHVIERRMFESDIRRHFLGTVAGSSETTLLLRGYVFVYDHTDNEYLGRNGQGTRLISVLSPGLIINVWPTTADVEAAGYRIDDAGHMVLTDGENFTLDIHEFGGSR